MGSDTMEDEKPSILALRASVAAYAAKIKKEVIEESMGFQELAGSSFSQIHFQDASETFQDGTTCNKSYEGNNFSETQELELDRDWKTFDSSTDFADDHKFSIDYELASSVNQNNRRCCKKYNCKICGRNFVKQQYLNDHLTIHTGAKPYKCDLCNRSFARKSLVTSHLMIHSDDRPFKCDDCGKTFGHKSNLTVHQRIHSGDRPYKCDICGAGFVKSGDLVRHKRSHSGERLYHCDVCEKTFVRSSSLNIHKKKHSGERPFKCNVCDMSFFTSGHLTRHRKVHLKNRLVIVIGGAKNRQK